MRLSFLAILTISTLCPCDAQMHLATSAALEPPSPGEFTSLLANPFASGPSDSLPDAPGFFTVKAAETGGWTLPAPAPALQPCPKPANHAYPPRPETPDESATEPAPCILVNPFHRFLNDTTPIPLTPGQKGYLAFHNLRDPGNLITIAGTAAFTVATNPHTAYGPGWNGFGRNIGYSLSQDATGEFFGTFLIPSLFHEDPHYHREPQASVPRRIVHALSRTAIAQHDDGSAMPNYAVLLTYPISAEISNLYVPGVHGNAASTARRIATGLATDPVNNLITEFLPDFASHINVRLIFVQRILNSVMAGNAGAVSP